jgi:hypothetical protein
MATPVYPRDVFTVVFDAKTQRLLGKNARWVSVAEFAKDPPQSADDMKPDPGDERTPVADSGKRDPGPYAKCKNGVWHVCWDSPTGASCHPIDPPRKCEGE